MRKIPRSIRAEYDATRETKQTSLLCHAPFVSLNFEQNGNATACCYNRSHVLGTYPQQSIAEMWRGPSAERLRRFIRQSDLGGGCEVCAVQLESRNFLGAHARHFDPFASEHTVLQMPKLMEFELKNTCNLECIMCHGYFSSLIRKNREGLPPLESPYDQAFVDQLTEFLPHLTDAKFLGGEPFLIDLCYAIWDRIREVNPGCNIHVTTNATILTPRVRRVLEGLRFGIVCSIDSFEKTTFEEIRRNASYEKVWENIQYFGEYTKAKKTWLSFSVCPITRNWHELPDMIRRANAMGSSMWFNTVFKPEKHSLRFLPAFLLRRIIERYRAEAGGLPRSSPTEQVNRGNFIDLISQLESWLMDKEKMEALHEPLKTKIGRCVDAATMADEAPGWSSEDNLTPDAMARTIQQYFVYKRGFEQAPGPEDEIAEREWIHRMIRFKENLLEPFSRLKEQDGRGAFLDHFLRALALFNTAVNDGNAEPSVDRRLEKLCPFLLEHPKRDLIIDEIYWYDASNLLKLVRSKSQGDLEHEFVIGYP